MAARPPAIKRVWRPREPIPASFLQAVSDFLLKSEAIPPLVWEPQTDGSVLFYIDSTQALFAHPFAVTADGDGTYTMAPGRLIDGIQITDVPQTDLGTLADGDYVWLEVLYANSGTRTVTPNHGAAIPEDETYADLALPVAGTWEPISTADAVPHPTAGGCRFIVPVCQIDKTTYPDQPIRQYQYSDLFIRFGPTYVKPVVVDVDVTDISTALVITKTVVDEYHLSGALVALGVPQLVTLHTTSDCPDT